MSKNIIETYLEEEMHNAFIDYSEEFIINRAIPNIYDGLKPVQRRILYAFSDLGITYEKQFKKSARVVGDVLGKWHPHGDYSVYEAMIRLGQPWNQRYPLVLIHGNAGSIDGDSAAAMRYTEVKSSQIADEFFDGLNKDVVEWTLNFDDSLYEPKILPTLFPNYLTNGGMGIASSISCDIPPHNLSEVIGVINNYIENPKATLLEHLKILKGPDFPTGGVIEGKDFEKIYKTGMGKFKVRAKYKLENQKNGRTNIVFYEIPYQTKNSNTIESIVDLIKNQILQGTYDLRDESSLEEGIRIVVEVKKDVDPNYVLKTLFQKTDLEKTQSVQMRAIMDGSQKTISLIGYIEAYLDFQKKNLRKKFTFDLEKMKSDLHIQEGFLICLERIKEVVMLISDSKESKSAKKALIESFGLTDLQAQAVLDLRLIRITSLGIKEVQDKVKTLKLEIKKIDKILSSEKNVLNHIKESLVRIDHTFGDKRRTKIVKNFEIIEAEKPKVEMTILIKDRIIKTYQTKNFKSDDGIIIDTDNDSVVILFNKNGQFFKYQSTSLPSKVPFDVIAAFSVKFAEDDFEIMFMTKNGQMKKTKLSEYDIKRENSTAIKLEKDDELIFAAKSDDRTLLLTNTGHDFILIPLKDVPLYGRATKGVKSINLSGDEVIRFVGYKESIEEIIIETDKEPISVKLSKLETLEIFKTHNIKKLLPKKIKSVTNLVIREKDN